MMASTSKQLDDSDLSDEELTPTQIAFNKAADHVRTITCKLKDNELLSLYGLYKQAMEGKCDQPKPSWFNTQAKYKWEAWNSLGDLPQEEAQKQYIALVQKYDPEWSGLTENSGKKECWVSVSCPQRPEEPKLLPKQLSIIEAARDNRPERISELLSDNPDLVHERDDGNLTALHWAADRNSTKALLALLKAKSPLDAKDECGQTALHYAVACGNIESIKILLEHGASKEVEDEDGVTPLDLADDENVRKILL